MSEENSRRHKRHEEDLTEEVKECRRHGYILTGKFLGQGAYAKVYLGQAIPEKVKNNYKLRRASHLNKSLKVAIKIISTASAPEVYVTKFLPREVSTMNRCYRHANVIQLYDLFATHKRIYLIMEYAECGDLLTYVNHCYSKRSNEEPLTEDRAREMFRDIIAGVHFIHSRGVAHRDLKCENILLAKNRQAKLSDFGFAIEPRQSRELLKTHCGSYAYAPPEILKQQRYDGKLADLWSIGVILFAMVNGGLPFKESDAKAVLAAMKKPVYFKGCLTADCKDLIRNLLKIRPQKRISLQEVLSHPWMRKPNDSCDKQAGGDDRDLIGDIPLIRGRSKDWKYSGQFLTAESVLKYLKERIGFRTSFPKHPQLRSGEEEYVKEEDVSAHTPTLTSVQLSPHLPKENVPATPMIPPNQMTKAALAKPKIAMEVFQKTNHSQPRGTNKSSTKFHNADSNLSSKLYPPLKLEAIASQTDVKELAAVADENISIANGCDEERHQKSPGRKVLASNKPIRRLSSSFRNETKMASKDRKSADHTSRPRRSATPNVVNLNIPSSQRASSRQSAKRPLSRKTQLDLQALQHVSIYNAHAHRKIRCGAVSVPPEVRSLHTSQSERKPPLKPTSSQRQNTASTIKKTAKTKSHSYETSATTNETFGDENSKIRKLSNKLLTIPEKDETSQKTQRNSTTPQNGTIRPIYDVENSSCDQGGFEKVYQGHAAPDHPRNTPVLAEHFQRPVMPARDKLGQAMAAWVGKQSTATSERGFMETLPATATQFLTQNQLYLRSFAENLYKAKIHRFPTESSPSEPGKLLYKRAQTNKNTLGTVTQSMRATPHPIFRRAQSPIHLTEDSMKPQLRGSQSPPPVLRFTHKMNRYK